MLEQLNIVELTDGFAQRQSLPLPCNHNHDLSCVHNGRDTNGQCHTRNQIDVVVEETRISENRVIRESLDTSSRSKRRTRFLPKRSETTS